MTSKAFRSFLLGPDGVLFWERLRRIAGGEPVDKPAHLSEPEFAVLLFSKHCHVSNNDGTVHACFVSL